MAAMLMAATASSSTVLRPTPFLGQSRGANANPLRDVVPMGTGKYTMVLSSLSLCIFLVFWVLSEIGFLNFVCDMNRGTNSGMGRTE